jgi:3-oxoacyl-[acyl-carrier protein] reductase
MPNSILVLGASGGIGSAIARQLYGAGANVMLHGRNQDRLKKLAGELGDRTEVFTADLTVQNEVTQLFEAIALSQRSLSGVVFSIANQFENRLTHRTPWSAFEKQINEQLKAFHFVAQASIKLLEKREDTSRLIVVSTEFVLGTPPIKTAPYVAAKAALSVYAQVIAQEWLERNIRVHIVAPGMVRTDLVSAMPVRYLDDVAAQMPEKRFTTVEDVARIVSFLFSSAADPLYGRLIQVSRAARR